MYRWRTILYRITTSLGLTGRVVRPKDHQQTLQEVVQVQLPREADTQRNLVDQRGLTLDKVETSDITDAMNETQTERQEAPERRTLDQELADAARNFKTSPRMLKFHLKVAEHRAALVGLAHECQNQGVHFELKQEGLVVLFEF